MRVAAPASFAGAVAATGLDHAPFADVAPEELRPIFGRLPELSRVEANRTVIAEVFGRLDARIALPGLTEIMASWRPDIIVREFCEFGSLVAAAKAGIPQVEVAIGLAATVAFALPISSPRVAELDAVAGLPEGTVQVAQVGFRSLKAQEPPGIGLGSSSSSITWGCGATGESMCR